MVLNSNEIQEILPHRYPFLLVDRVLTLEKGVRATGIKCVTTNEMHFIGHFPTEHVMPGVLIIEALAQLGAIVVLSVPENSDKTAYFASIKNAKFRHKVVPGDVLKLEAELSKIKGKAGIGKCVAYVDDNVVCETEITFVLGA